jgi:hypothetical protein
LANTRPIMSTGIWPAAILSSLATPARISLAANHIRASSPGRRWRRHGQRCGQLEAACGIQRQPSARSGASVHTAVVQRATEVVEGLRLLCGVVEKPTDNRRARSLCYPAAAAHSRATSRRPPAQSATPLPRLGRTSFDASPVPGWGAFRCRDRGCAIGSITARRQ